MYRYFVVVDDIWDVDTWHVLKLALPVASSGSIIITTTRINDVAESCRSRAYNGDIYSIKPLDMVHSRQLFYTRLFNSEEDCPSSLEKVSDEILKKCGGLPLAIVSIANLLASYRSAEGTYMWKRVSKSIGSQMESHPNLDGMRWLITLSYDYLPHLLKACMMYLRIFPEDYVIAKDRLLYRWFDEVLVT